MSVSRHGWLGIRRTGGGLSLKTRLPELVKPTSGSEELIRRTKPDWSSFGSFARTVNLLSVSNVGSGCRLGRAAL